MNLYHDANLVSETFLLEGRWSKKAQVEVVELMQHAAPIKILFDVQSVFM
jgi:hypothetical protein